MMKEKKRLIVVLLAFVLAFTGISIVQGTSIKVMAATLAEDESFVALPYKEVTVIEGIPVPEEEAYSEWLFAGWFKDATCTINTAVRDKNTVGSTCFAKFVPKDVLSIKAQVGTEKVDDSYIIRFVSSVESLNYNKVGFEVTREGMEKTLTSISNTVYEKIDSTSKGVEYEFNPKVVDAKSEYFMTAKLKTKSENTNYIVRVFWETLDGTKVYGVSRSVSVNDGAATALVNVSFQASEGSEIKKGDNLQVTYGNKKNGTAEVIGVDGKNVHTRITLEDNASGQTLPSATRFEFKKDSNTVGDAVYRNLYTDYTGENTYDTTWYSIYQDENEFVIATDADLFGFAQLCKNADSEYFKDKTVMLGASIAVDEDVMWPVATKFAGTFDGQDETISGIKVGNNNEKTYQGFFGTTTEDSMIQNFRLKDSSFTSNDGNVGSIVGKLGGSMDSVYSDAKVESSASNVGGLVGSADSSAEKINNCWYEGKVECTTETATEMHVAGILGEMESGSIAIQNCLNNGEIKYTFKTDADIQVNVAGIYGGDGEEAKISNTLNAGEVIVETTSGTAHTDGVDSIAVNSTAIQNAVYATTESSKVINKKVTSVASTLLKGYTGYEYANSLGFSTKSKQNGYWVARAKDVPALKTFVDDEIDVAWYYETEGDAYTLTTAEQLYGFAAISLRKNFDGKVVKLGANITLNKGNATTWKEKAASREWISIGTDACPFDGTFDGQGYTISGLYLKTNKSYQGLFGDASEDSVIKNFRIVNSYYENYSAEQGEIFAMGSVVGRTYGCVEKIYSDAILVSNTLQTGGIVGRIESKYKEVDDEKTYTSEATVNDCWFAGTVNSSGANAGHNGGVVGAIWNGNSNVTNCLVTGEVSTKDSSYQPFTGGIIGLVHYDTNVNIVGCLNAGTVTTSNLDGAYDYSIVGRIRGSENYGPAIVSMTGVYGVNSNTGAYKVANPVTVNGQAELIENKEEMNGDSAFSLLGLDFTDYWVAKEGATPELRSFSKADYTPSGTQPHTGWFNAGKDTHTIMTPADLYGLSELGKKNNFAGETILLGADITLNTLAEGKTTLDWEKTAPENEWIPVGIYNTSTFAGTIDGQGHTLKGLYVNQDSAYASFLTAMATGSVVKDIRFEDCYFRSEASHAGTVAGRMMGTIDSVYSDAVVKAPQYLGGITGQTEGAADVISNCWFDGQVYLTDSSKYGAGGMVGRVVKALTLSNCLNTGVLYGCENASTNDVGGIVGRASGSAAAKATTKIENCLHAGIMKDGTTVGTLLGGNRYSNTTIVNSYTITEGESCYGFKNNGGTLDDTTAKLYSKEAEIKGEHAFKQMSALDYDDIWVAKEGTTPELQAFSLLEGQIAVTDTVPDTRWYNETDTEFVIHTAREMYGLAKLVNDGNKFAGKTIKLGSDIVLNEGNAKEWIDNDKPEGIDVWEPIGLSSSKYFNGTFDGQGHTISGMYVMRTSQHAGLFGFTESASVLRNFRIINSYVDSRSDSNGKAGVAVGVAKGNVDSIYVDATIKARGVLIGGIAGQSTVGGYISNCWFAGKIIAGTSSDQIGGIVGYITGKNNTTTIEHCLYTGEIVCENVDATKIGGIGGECYVSGVQTIVVKDCLIAGTVGDKKNAGAVFGKNASGSTVECESVYTTLSDDYSIIRDDAQENNYTVSFVKEIDIKGTSAHTKLNELDFVNYWVVKEDSLPELQIFSNIKGSININKMVEADTTWYNEADTVFTITTIEELYGLAELSNGGNTFEGKTIKLSKDIYLNEGDATEWSQNAPLNTWTPIGKATAFAGTFDGQGHKISGMYINETSSNNVGLFAQTAVGSTIKNLAIINSYIKSTKQFVGSVAGIALGTFDTIYSDAIIEMASNDAGGIGGTVNAGTENKFKNCWFNGTITGIGQSAYYMGGIVGAVRNANTEAIMNNCLSTGTITSIRTEAQNVGSVVGGLCGSVFTAGTKLKVVDSVFTGQLVCINKKTVGTVIGDLRHGTVEMDGVYYVNDEYDYPATAAYSTSETREIIGEATVFTAKEFTGETAKVNADSLDYKTMWQCVENRTPILRSFSRYVKGVPVTLLGNSIDFYDIVISSKASTLTKMMAEYFQEIIYEETGALLDMITDAEVESEYEILFGDTTRAGSDVLYTNGKYNANTVGYSIKSVTNKIVIGYSDSSSLTGAYDAFLELLTNDTTNGINVSGTYDAMTQVNKTGDIRVMSSNIYGKNGHDFDKLGMPWEARAEIMADVYKVYQPDFIGLQESTFEQEQEILKYIGDMYAVVPFAEADQNRTPLLYRKDLYKLEASYYYDFTGGRHLEWALYSSIENPDEKFIHMNLHYLPVGNTTDDTYATKLAEQVEQAKLVNVEIKRLMTKYPGVPIAVSGDYNHVSSSETYLAMIDGINMSSGSVILNSTEDSAWYTQHSLGKEVLETTKGGKIGPIDHVTITTDTLEAKAYKVIHHPLACWGSDHYAIFVDMNRVR